MNLATPITKKYIVLNFYHFFPVDDTENEREWYKGKASELSLEGTIQIAPEGINFGLSGDKSNLEAFIAAFKDHISFPANEELRVAWSDGTSRPFRKLRVKVKERILIFDKNHWVNPDEIGEASYMETEKWDALISENPDNLVVLDTRNDYELDYGTFEHADHLDIGHFRDFPEKFLEKYSEDKEKIYLMFCTGGIRCEKAAVFAKKHGFNNVYQLEGGIFEYFKKRGRGHWNGSCFVFDGRWAVNPDLSESEDGPHPDQLDRVHNLV